MAFVTHEIKSEGYAIITIAREPVNSMNLQLWQELNDNFELLEKNPKIRAVIFRSGLKKRIFTAGNDINELYAPKTNKERYINFMDTHNRTLLNIYKSRLYTVAAIKGACPAGGCILGLCCDYRIMTKTGEIGLNEVKLGVPVPPPWTLIMRQLIGGHHAETMLKSAVLAKPDQALSMGLINEICQSDEDADLLKQAEDRVKHQLFKVLMLRNDVGFVETKLLLRREIADYWEKVLTRENQEKAWDTIINNPVVIRSLKMILDQLSKSKL